MIRIPKEQIVAKIKEKTGLSDSEINAKIKKKLDSLSGLISEEGAAHIIANELGIKVYDEAGKLQIKNIVPGMGNVTVAGKVTRVFEIRTFETEARKGKLGSFMIADETGMIRVVAWNDKADLLNDLKQDMLVKIESGYARESNRGQVELHLGDRSKLTINPEGVADIKTKTVGEGVRKSISQLKENEENVEILGTIVQVFDPKFFEICPECSKRVKEKDGAYICDMHNAVTPTYSYVLNLFLDDGTDNVRVVLWRNQVQRLLGKTHEEIVDMRTKSFEEVKNDLLGKIIKFAGRTSKNEMFERIEFIPQLVFTDPNPEEEIARLKNEKSASPGEPAAQPAPKPKAPSQEEAKKPSPKKDEPKPSSDKKPKGGDKPADDFEILSLEDLENLD